MDFLEGRRPTLNRSIFMVISIVNLFLMLRYRMEYAKTLSIVECIFILGQSLCSKNN